MSKETTFEINPDQISEIVEDLWKESPDQKRGQGEFQHAIFESLVDHYNLRWDKRGFPDYNDPQVKSLNRAYSEYLEKENNVETLDGIEGRCTTEDCDWKIEAQAKVNKQDRFLERCDLTHKCGLHHQDSNDMTQHNHFSLYKEGEQVGSASVSSQAHIGYIEPLE